MNISFLDVIILLNVVFVPQLCLIGFISEFNKWQRLTESYGGLSKSITVEYFLTAGVPLIQICAIVIYMMISSLMANSISPGRIIVMTAITVIWLFVATKVFSRGIHIRK